MTCAKITARRALTAVLLLCLAACAGLQPTASHTEIVAVELNHIIMAKGLPCGRVLDYSLDDRLDYRVHCESGLVVRIRVTAEGHVEAMSPAAGMARRP